MARRHVAPRRIPSFVSSGTSGEQSVHADVSAQPSPTASQHPEHQEYPEQAASPHLINLQTTDLASVPTSIDFGSFSPALSGLSGRQPRSRATPQGTPRAPPEPRHTLDITLSNVSTMHPVSSTHTREG